MVFCREIAWNDADETDDALDGVCNMTDMSPRQNRASNKRAREQKEVEVAARAGAREKMQEAVAFCCKHFRHYA